MEETPQNKNQQLADYVKQARASGMSDKEIEQELQNALQPSHKRIPKFLISVVGIIGLLVGYFGVVQLNKQPNPASSPTATPTPTPTPTPLLKTVSIPEPLPITWTGWNRAKVGLVSAELQGVSFADIPGMDDEIELKGKTFLLVLNLKIKVQDGGFCSSSLAESMRLVLENEEFAAPLYTPEDCGQNFTTLNDQKVAFAVEPKAPEYLFRINELFGSSSGSQFYFRITQTETELAAIAEAHYINSCKAQPQLSGACFEIRGRMAIYNGNPSLRIWPVGTKRFLALSERRGSMNEDYNVPKELLEQLSYGKAMYADFTICPFTDDEPGVMRLVCVESAKNISIRDWP